VTHDRVISSPSKGAHFIQMKKFIWFENNIFGQLKKKQELCEQIVL
jgi:hypothetical protein